MDEQNVAALLEPFLEAGPAAAAQLAPAQLHLISMYIDLLLRWKQRVNLTAIRTPEEIVTRHFGESLFAARHICPACTRHTSPSSSEDSHGYLLVDLGSGAGFPGLPIKIWTPETRVTLIESNHKKVAFLREVIRALTLTDIDVFPGRAEDFPSKANTLTLRAVERFDPTLPIAVSLLAPIATLALLISTAQIARAQAIASSLHWSAPIPIPQSAARVLLLARVNEPGK